MKSSSHSEGLRPEPFYLGVVFAACGLAPSLFLVRETQAALAAIYPATWGLVQLGTGALSDRIGRKWLIASGMWTQATGIAITLSNPSRRHR